MEPHHLALVTLTHRYRRLTSGSGGRGGGDRRGRARGAGCWAVARLTLLVRGVDGQCRGGRCSGSTVKCSHAAPRPSRCGVRQLHAHLAQGRPARARRCSFLLGVRAPSPYSPASDKLTGSVTEQRQARVLRATTSGPPLFALLLSERHAAAERAGSCRRDRPQWARRQQASAHGPRPKSSTAPGTGGHVLRSGVTVATR